MSDNDTIDIVTTMPNRYKSFSDKALKVENLNGITIHRINLGTHKNGFWDQSMLFVKFAYHVWSMIKKREQYDIVFATSSRLMTAFLGAFIAKKQNSKLFLDIRDIFTDTLESIFKDRKLKHIIPLFRMIEKYTINSAQQINLVSKGFEEYFMGLNNKITYTFYSNGIDDIFINYDFSKESSSEKKIITYAGNIGEGQGLEKIIPQMAQKLGRDYEIYIIGDGGSKEKLIKSLNNIDNVKLFNPVSRNKLLEIYKNSDFLFLHLNDYEAFQKVLPSKLFEYAATNKVILAGVSGYAKKFIEEYIDNSIVFEPCNVDELYSKFIKITNINNINREKFINEYNRTKIMHSLTQEVYTL